ncbi:MAG: prepilin-type N-terminal cleavage/methylation domain-containing protein [Lachnospiraceae bacterium]|nr:prepilin-type N-terminal cleavage/methylation domain-containing protein [Lachnospiraceae bacterium]
MNKKIFGKLFRRKKNSAFSLVEVLCAIVLLAIVATPILQALYSGLNVNIKSRKLLGAADLTSDTMEFISSLVYEDYTYTEGGADYEVPGLERYYRGDSTNVTSLLLNTASTVYPGGPVCTYSSLSGGTYTSPYQSTNPDPDNGNHCTNLELTNIVMDGIKYDMTITVVDEEDPSSTTKSFYCFKVDVIVRESASGKFLSYASTKIANSY